MSYYTYEKVEQGMTQEGPGYQESTDIGFQEVTLTTAANGGGVIALFRHSGVGPPEQYVNGAWVVAVKPIPGMPI